MFGINWRHSRRLLGVGVCFGLLTGCMNPSTPLTDTEPTTLQVTSTQSILLALPLPEAPVPIAVYGFEDKTGQFKPQENVQTLSRAVSQGGDAILIKALRDAGDGKWFRVLERSGLDNLLKERKIIREMRSRYLGETEFNPNALPPLLFAGVILEGGIVGFDTNTLTGGAGARFLSIGADVKYRQNAVTVNLRAVSVKTGEVLANVTTTKMIASIGLQGGVFKYVSFDELLEIEAGITNNEPDTLALRRTIEKSVHSLIVEGSEAGLWAFEDEAAGAELVAALRVEQFGSQSSSNPVASDPPAEPAKSAFAKAIAPAPAPAPKTAAVEIAQKSNVPSRRLGEARPSDSPKPTAVKTDASQVAKLEADRASSKKVSDSPTVTNVPPTGAEQKPTVLLKTLIPGAEDATKSSELAGTPIVKLAAEEPAGAVGGQK